jgi:hypothetical protein
VKTHSLKRFWKNLCLCIFVVCAGLSTAEGQCSNTLQSISYDTLVPGTGNNTHLFTFSQFDPAIGTLVSARINALVTVNYGFTLQNVEAVQRDFSVSVGRYDNFTSTALSTPYTNLLNIPDGNYLLNPGDEVIQAPATILYRYLNSDSVTTNTADFLGGGSVAFNYTPITYTNLTGSNVYYYSATASDTIDFSITYFYCNATVLPISLTNFQAIKQGMDKIALSWQTMNDPGGSAYEIQKSSDGQHFDSVHVMHSLPAGVETDAYLYDYVLNTGDKNRIFFRIKITDTKGSISYSDIREVDLSASALGFGMYPNPCNSFINLAFDQQLPGDWQIDIYTSTGRILQTNLFTKTNFAPISFEKRLAAGVYFIRAANLDNGQNYVRAFSVK